MTSFFKYAFLIAVLLPASISLVEAKFDQRIADSYIKMASEGYKIGPHGIAKPVLAAKLLAHELSLEADPAKAKDMADTLLSMLSTGEGVGGISLTPANDGERPLMIEALREATRFLQTQENFAAPTDVLTEEQLAQKLKAFNTAAKDHEKDHLAHVTAIVFSAFKKHGGITGLPTLKADLQRILDGTTWLKASMNQEEYWRYVGDYLDRAVEQRVYNAALKKEIDMLRGIEETAEGGMDYTNQEIMMAYARSIVPDAGSTLLKTLTNKLKETVIPEKAYQLACSMVLQLKRADFDFANLLTDPDRMPDALDALITIATYRMFETKQGYLERMDPSIFTFQNTAQSAESEAVLLALVSAIQSILRNPDLSDDELVAQFKYQIPKSPFKATGALVITLERCAADALKESYKKALELVKSGEIKTLFERLGLSKKVKVARLNIKKVQKLAIDAEAMKQKLFFVPMPIFDFSSADGSALPIQPKFMRFVKSLGDGQCGWYSLRHPEGYAEYVQQILDNLDDPEIYRLAIHMTKAGADLFTKHEKKELHIDADKQGKVDGIVVRIKQLQDKYAADTKKYRDAGGKILAQHASTVSNITIKLEEAKARIYTELALAVGYSHEDLAKKLIEDIDNITTASGGNRGWYTNTATSAWRLQPVQPDLVSVILNNHDVYSWVPITSKRERPSIIEDGQTALIGFTSPRKALPESHTQRVHLYNESGGIHYDKWVEVSDTSAYYADMAAALRHKQKHRQSNTR